MRPYQRYFSQIAKKYLIRGKQYAPLERTIKPQEYEKSRNPRLDVGAEGFEPPTLCL